MKMLRSLATEDLQMRFYENRVGWQHDILLNPGFLLNQKLPYKIYLLDI